MVYVSPLKALAVDVERNLRAPLTGIRQAATRLGLSQPDVRVAVRSGDTPADERRAVTRTPPDVLITVPRDAAGTLDFHRAAAMIELGRELTAQRLDELGA